MLTFDDIRPYNDQEASEALRKVAYNPATMIISKYLFPKESMFKLSRILRTIKGVDDFQERVMSCAVDSIMDQTSDGLIVEGIDILKSQKGRYIVMSNHRDIVMDPALLQIALFKEGLPCTHLCIGSNLLSMDYVNALMRSNRMIKVMRGLSAREIYESSQLMSSYIRETIKNDVSSIWIAQREGRAKDGMDSTEQAIMKMLNMSGQGEFDQNFKELNIIPMSISYEFESCDIFRAKELYIKSRDKKYVKGKLEDINSILTGIKQKKGRVCINFGKPLSAADIDSVMELKGNERYKGLCDIMDSRILEGYRLWPNNYIAADMINGNNAYSEHYTEDELNTFKSYVDSQMKSLKEKKEEHLDRDALRDIFLRIYANPVLRREA